MNITDPTEIAQHNSDKQSQLISTHNDIPYGRDLEQKHFDRAVTFRKNSTLNAVPENKAVEQPVKEEEKNIEEEPKKRGRPPIAKE